jgi:hypothetical protein
MRASIRKKENANNAEQPIEDHQVLSEDFSAWSGSNERRCWLLESSEPCNYS